MKVKLLILISVLVRTSIPLWGIDHLGITFNTLSVDRFTLIEKGYPTSILIDKNEDEGVVIAVENLINDFFNITENKPSLLYTPKKERVIIIGQLTSSYVKELIKTKKIDASELKGRNEKYIITTLFNPMPDVDEALVIAGSDKRGTIYGIYELSEQIGVSPWYDWADVPVEKKQIYLLLEEIIQLENRL